MPNEKPPLEFVVVVATTVPEAFVKITLTLANPVSLGE